MMKNRKISQNELEKTENDPSTVAQNMAGTFTKKQKNNYVRKYDPSYLAYGFTDKDNCPQCVVCLEVLANSAMAPAKLKRHLKKKHTEYKNKSKAFFQRKEYELQSQVKSIKKLSHVTVNKQALKTSFVIAHHIAKSKRNFTIAETLIMPCLIDACQIMAGDNYAKLMKTIPLSNDSVSKRIKLMCVDVEFQLIQKIKASGMYALQLDESKDIVGKALLLIYIRYIDWEECEIKEDLLNCLELKGHTTGNEIFMALSDYFLSIDIKLADCISVCTDGAANMTGKKLGLVARMKEVAPNMKSIHCVIHREMLASKGINLELSIVLTTAIKTVNFIKSNALNSRLFENLCKEMESSHLTLLLHTEIRWLSRGRILKRLCELKEEIIIFLSNKNCDLMKYFQDTDWYMKLCYLADVFHHLNEVNLSMQGRQKTIFDSYSKIEGLKKKLKLWIHRVENNCFDMFTNLNDLLQETNDRNENYNHNELVLVISNHLKMLQVKFEEYFPINEDPKKDTLWVLDPFDFTDSQNVLSTTEEDMLAELSSDVTLRNVKKKSSLDQFWIKTNKEYKILSNKAIEVILAFSSTYLCESGFSTVTATKNKERNRLNLSSIIRLSLTNIAPNIEALCKSMQAHPSH